MRRRPAVAGAFYPADPHELRREVETCLGTDRAPEPAIALLAPHAGYIYSGPCAGRVYSIVSVPRRVVVLCPNHTGRGAALALMEEGEWEMPFGAVPIDEDLAVRLRTLDPELTVDSAAHAREHALEVQLPFLQILNPALRIVPICVGTRRLESLVALGETIAKSIRESIAEEREILIVISSDMSHYIPLALAKKLDALAIERMEALDAEGLHEVVEREEISMCGYCPAVAGIAAARALGASRGRLVSYTSSGERTHDESSVVAYAGLVFR